MAAIDIADCTVTVDAALPGFNVYKIVTPATADDTDTIDISSICAITKIVSATCYGSTDDWEPVLVITAASGLAIPGSTDNEARTIHVLGRL